MPYVHLYLSKEKCHDIAGLLHQYQSLFYSRLLINHGIFRLRFAGKLRSKYSASFFLWQMFRQLLAVSNSFLKNDVSRLSWGGSFFCSSLAHHIFRLQSIFEMSSDSESDDNLWRTVPILHPDILREELEIKDSDPVIKMRRQAWVFANRFGYFHLTLQLLTHFDFHTQSPGRRRKSNERWKKRWPQRFPIVWIIIQQMISMQKLHISGEKLHVLVEKTTSKPSSYEISARTDCIVNLSPIEYC